MLNWFTNHWLLTLAWLVSGLIVWAWSNFNIEVNESGNPQKTKFKYLALFVFLFSGGLISLLGCLFSFGSLGYKIRVGLKFN